MKGKQQSFPSFINPRNRKRNHIMATTKTDKADSTSDNEEGQASDLTLKIDSSGQVTAEFFLNFLTALAGSVRYTDSAGNSFIRVKNRKLLETLVGTTKTSQKLSLFGETLTAGQTKTLRETAGYTPDGSYLKQDQYKG